MGDPGRPPWWEENDRLRERMGLPEYTPPRFADGSYSHEVVARAEERYGVTVRILGVNTRYPDDLGVWVDGEELFPVGRHRDDGGNTVYEITAGEFMDRLAAALEG